MIGLVGLFKWLGFGSYFYRKESLKHKAYKLQLIRANPDMSSLQLDIITQKEQPLSYFTVFWKSLLSIMVLDTVLTLVGLIVFAAAGGFNTPTPTSGSVNTGGSYFNVGTTTTTTTRY